MQTRRDDGGTLVEVLVSTAVAAVAMAGAAGLLAASARAVADSELETTATWVASRTIEEWRANADAPLEGRHEVTRAGERLGDAGAAHGVLVVEWVAQAEPEGVGLWCVVVTVSGARLHSAVTAEAVVRRGTP